MTPHADGGICHGPRNQGDQEIHSTSTAEIREDLSKQQKACFSLACEARGADEGQSDHYGGWKVEAWIYPSLLDKAKAG